MSTTLELCDRELSERLKKAGFDWEVMDYVYESDDCDINVRSTIIHPKNHNSLGITISCPTLHHAAMWLREVKGVHVVPIMERSGFWFFNTQEVDYPHLTTATVSKEPFDTHDLALAAGIDAALELLEKDSK